jgi:hypothetical protein
LPNGVLVLPFLAVRACDQAAAKVDEDPLGAFQLAVTIDTLALDRAVVHFNAKFHDLSGRISGLEAIAEKRADVLLEGMWSNHAPV